MSEDDDALAELLPGDVTADARAALGRFTALVRQWSKKTDLVRVRGPAELAELLFLDAIVLARRAPVGGRVIDVGAGAGAPALPLAVLRPDLVMTLLEPRRRRVTFMRLAAGALGLGTRVTIEEGKLEDPPVVEHAGRFDLAYSRATFAPAEWLRRGTALASQVAVLLAREERPTPPAGWVLQAADDYQVPTSDAPRCAALYRREGTGQNPPSLVPSGS